jgi:hypothetical protein
MLEDQVVIPMNDASAASTGAMTLSKNDLGMNASSSPMMIFPPVPLTVYRKEKEEECNPLFRFTW